MNLYRNIKTGATISTNNVINAVDWEEVKPPKTAQKSAPKKKAVKKNGTGDSK